MTQHFLSDDGLRLAYDDRGLGKPLLCLAGLTRNMEDFEPMMAALPLTCRIIRLDSRGRGSSDDARDAGEYSLLREARDVLGLMDHLGLAAATVIGTSRGGLLALTMAQLQRDRLCGVVLNDIGPDLDPRGVARIMDYLGIPPTHPDLDAAAAALAAAMSADFPGVTPAQWRAQAARMWRQAPTGLALRYDPALRQAFMSPSRPIADLWAGFDALAALPVAVIRGQHSDILAPETVEAMARRHPGLICATVPDRGHVPFLDEAESIAAIVTVLARA